MHDPKIPEISDDDSFSDIELVTADTPWIAHIPPGNRMVRNTINDMLDYNNVRRDAENDKMNRTL